MNIQNLTFKKSQKTAEKPKVKTPYSPYLAARAEWNERYGDFQKAAKDARIMALLAMCLAVPSVAYGLYASSQARYKPYIVEVDKLGNVQAAGPAKAIAFNQNFVVEAALSDFIANLRAVSVDGLLQRQRIDKLYAYISADDPAITRINSYFRTDGDPFKIARKKTVSVKIVAVNQITDQSYRVEWTEQDFDRKGARGDFRRFQAILGVRIAPPTTDAVIRVNPIGVYITEIDWTEVKE